MRANEKYEMLDGIAAKDNLGNAFEVNVESVHNVTPAFLPLLTEGNLNKVLNL